MKSELAVDDGEILVETYFGRCLEGVIEYWVAFEGKEIGMKRERAPHWYEIFGGDANTDINY